MEKMELLTRDQIKIEIVFLLNRSDWLTQILELDFDPVQMEILKAFASEAFFDGQVRGFSACADTTLETINKHFGVT